MPGIGLGAGETVLRKIKTLSYGAYVSVGQRETSCREAMSALNREGREEWGRSWWVKRGSCVAAGGRADGGNRQCGAVARGPVGLEKGEAGGRPRGPRMLQSALWVLF